MRYPEAQWLGNGQSGGSYTGGPHRLVIHTTETAGLPSYQSGATAPHITYHPGFRAFYQHTDFNTAARALRNEAGGVQTNRRSALQIEIICYSAKNIADQTISRQWVGDLSDDNYEDLREFIAWCVDTFGVKPHWPGKQALSYAQANASGFRMTGAEWDAFDGVCGHQHVPENTHWDPGAIDWKKLLPEDDMPAPKDWDAEDWEAFGKNVNGYTMGAWYGVDPNRRRVIDMIQSTEALIRQVAQGRTLSDVDIDRIIAEHAESFGLIERDEE